VHQALVTEFSSVRPALIIATTVCLIQTLFATLCLCLAARANDQTASQRSDSASPSELRATCRDRFGSLPVSRFALRSCAMCYVYLGNATHSRRLLPVPGHYEALAMVDSNYTVTRVRLSCTKWAKKSTPPRNILHITSSKLVDFLSLLQSPENLQCLNIPSHLKRVATLPCEMFLCQKTSVSCAL